MWIREGVCVEGFIKGEGSRGDNITVSISRNKNISQLPLPSLDDPRAAGAVDLNDKTGPGRQVSPSALCDS